MALGNRGLGCFIAQFPLHRAGPTRGYAGEVMQHNAKAQVPINPGIILVRPFHQGDEPIVDNETVGLSV